MKKYLNIVINIFLSLISGAGVTNIADDNSKSFDYTPLVYSGFLGGTGADEISDVKYYGGFLYAVGTSSGSVKTTAGALNDRNSGGKDIFLCKYRLENGLPVDLVYSTMYGGTGNDIVSKIIIGNNGFLYITGSTDSPDLPSGHTSLDSTYNGNGDIFVAILQPDIRGNYDLVFTTYLGGSETDTPSGIIVADSLLYLAGTTSSNDYPATKGAFNENPNGEDEAFATVFSLNNFNKVSIKYSTYFGGDKSESANSLAINKSGEIILSGTTLSDDLIITQGAYSSKYISGSDGFAAVLKPNAGGIADLIYSTYFGGSGSDVVNSSAVTNDGKIILIGYTDSGDLPVTPQAVFGSLKGKNDIFTAVIDPHLSNAEGLIYSTYLGGSSNDLPYSSLIDSSGRVTIAGMTESINFPTVSGSYDRTYNGMKDVFFVSLNINENPDKILGYSTFIGSNKNESAFALCALPDDRYCLAGTTDSRLYPITENALDKEFDSETDGFISVLYLIPLKITSVSSRKLCWGDSLFIDYFAGDYNSNNIFTFELSDSAGGFSSPIFLGSLQSSASGIFGCRIPNGLPLSDKYRLRVRASSPYNVFYSDTSFITIVPLPNVVFKFRTDICYNSPPVRLEGGEPAGGKYSGNGVVDGWFYPTMAGIGSCKVFYTVENEFGCSKSAEFSVYVRELPPTPIISNNGGTLESNIPFGNSWYLDGEPIPGATGRSITPVQFGNYTVTATNAWGCSSFPSEPYNYNTVNNKPVFSLGSEPLAASPGQIVAVPIFLENAGFIEQFGINKISARLKFNSTILEPWYDTPQGYIRGGMRIIEIDLDMGSMPGKITKDIYLRATLGNDTATVIEIDNVTSDKGNFAYVAQPVSFSLLGVCREGGPRLTGSFGRTELVPPAPNPAGTICNFEFEIVEKGMVQLSLVSIAGETASVLLNENLEPGRRLISKDLSEIPAGSYFLILKTPGKVRVQRMSIVK